MKNKILILFITILLIIVLSSSIYAAGFSLSPGRIKGDTTYVISGEQSGGFKSELIFPIEQQIMQLGFIANINKFKLDNFKISYKKNIEEESGIFIDSDWLYSYSSDKAIYSESDSYLDFYTADLAVDFMPLYTNKSRNISLNLRAGYQRQHFDFDIHNLEQINYSSGRETIVPGQVLTYQIDYNFPYLGLNLSNEIKQETWDYNLALLFSPFLEGEDRDDHVLRDKLSYIDASGRAIMAQANLNYNLNSNFSFFLAWDYLNLEADGKQVQKDYYGNVLFEDIDAELNSTQNSLTYGVELLF